MTIVLIYGIIVIVKHDDAERKRGSIMKVQVGKRFKEVATVAQMPAVRRLVEDMKEDALPIASYAKMALDALGYGCDWEVYRPKAVVSFNGRVDDRYFDGSGHLDVWIEFLAFNENEGALDCGAKN